MRHDKIVEKIERFVMTGLQRCSTCKSEQELKYYSRNRNGYYYKT